MQHDYLRDKCLAELLDSTIRGSDTIHFELIVAASFGAASAPTSVDVEHYLSWP
jgi:hypothetical protein